MNYLNIFAKWHRLPTSQPQYRHLSFHTHTHTCQANERMNEQNDGRTEWTERKKNPKTKMKKLFSLFAICCFVVSSTIVLCACRLPAASFVHSPKTNCKKHSSEQMKNRRIRIRLTCIVYLLFAMRYSFALYILYSIVFWLFGMVCAVCTVYTGCTVCTPISFASTTDTRAHCLSFLNLKSDFAIQRYISLYL